MQIHSENLHFCRHSIAVTPPRRLSWINLQCWHELSTFEGPFSHVSQGQFLPISDPTQLLPSSCFYSNWWKMGEKRLSYRELHSKFGCEKFRNFHPAAFEFCLLGCSKVHSFELSIDFRFCTRILASLSAQMQLEITKHTKFVKGCKGSWINMLKRS